MACTFSWIRVRGARSVQVLRASLLNALVHLTIDCRSGLCRKTAELGITFLFCLVLVVREDLQLFHCAECSDAR